MHPSSILSYYPTYGLLDEVVSYSDYKSMNLYIDLKNCLQTLYMEHAILNIVESSQQTNFADTSIFTSVMSFLRFHKLYAVKRQMKMNVYVFFETGQSYYHKNISKKYKISRRIDDLYGLEREKRELFFTVVHKNLMLIEKACNKMPNIHVVRLQNLEADFVPYYLISRKLVCTEDDTCHLVYSNDHDLMQTVTAGDNAYIFQKVPKKKTLVKRNDVMKKELKCDCDIEDEWQPLAMSVIGDSGDDVDGIKGVGGKTFLKMFPDLKAMVGSMDQLFENVLKGNDIFDLTKTSTNPNKYMSIVIEKETKEKFVSNNLKLVSFELISRHIDDPDKLEDVERKKHIQSIVSEAAIAPMEALRKGLEMNRVYLPGDELEVIYHGH